MDNSKANIFMKLNSDECISMFKHARLNTVILFGSILTEEFAEHSDIDLAILSDFDISYSEILLLEEDLKKILKRDVDIINLKNKNLDLNMKVTIYDNGTIIFQCDNLKLYNMDYEETEMLFKSNETFRFFRERDVIFSE